MTYGNVLNKVTKEYISNVLIQEYVPHYPDNDNDTNWLVNPDVRDVIGIDTSLWVIELDTNGHLVRVRRMTPQEMDTNPTLVAQAKLLQTAVIDNACSDGITGGLLSSALGYPRVYDAQMVDQLNMIAAIAATLPNLQHPTGGSIPYACRDPVTGHKDYIVHSFQQLRQVLIDGAAVKLQNLIKCTTKKAYINAMTSVSQVKAITWDSTP